MEDNQSCSMKSNEIMEELEKLKEQLKIKSEKIENLEQVVKERDDMIMRLKKNLGIDGDNLDDIPLWYRSTTPLSQTQTDNTLIVGAKNISRTKSPTIPEWYSSENKGYRTVTENYSSPEKEQKWFHGKPHRDRGMKHFFFHVGGTVVNPEWDFGRQNPCHNYEFVEKKNGGKMMYRCMGH